MINQIKKMVKKVLRAEEIGFHRRIQLMIRTAQKLIYRKTYTANDVVGKLKSLGVGYGTNICLHSSWGSMFGCKSTPMELIQAVLELIGPEATLMMPAITNPNNIEVFDVRKTSSISGVVSETFRKMDGVKRSINICSSACAYGPNAKFLVEDHLKSKKPWDEFSPWHKFCELGGVVVELGLHRYINYISIMHCTTCELSKDIPYFDVQISKKRVYKYVDYNGNEGTAECLIRTNGSEQSIEKFVKKHMRSGFIKHTKISNVHISVVDAKTLHYRTNELAYEGKIIYTLPKPLKNQLPDKACKPKL